MPTLLTLQRAAGKALPAALGPLLGREDEDLLLISYPEKLLPKGKEPPWERKREHGIGRGRYLRSSFDIANNPPHPKPWRPFQKSEMLLNKPCMGVFTGGSLGEDGCCCRTLTGCVGAKSPALAMATPLLPRRGAPGADQAPRASGAPRDCRKAAFCH